MEGLCDIVYVDTDFPQSLCFALEETYFLEYVLPSSPYFPPTSPPHPGIPDLGISLRQTVQEDESRHHGWVRDRSTSHRALRRGGAIQLMPLRFCARFRGTDSWGNPAVWRKGRAVWWVQDNGKESNKRKREHAARRDSTTEDEDAREDENTTEDEGTTEGEDGEEERETKAKEESIEVKGEPISPPPLRR